MTAKSINSAIHFAAWFVQKATKSGKKLSHIKLQNMLFLAQLQHGVSCGGVLMPSMFVCYQDGFYEPSVKLMFKSKIPLEEGFFKRSEEDLLETVWNKYSSLSDDELLTQVCALSLWKNNYKVDNEVIVNPMEYTTNLPKNSVAKKAESGAKIRLSQNGPVEVSPWRPRKINDDKKVN